MELVSVKLTLREDPRDWVNLMPFQPVFSRERERLRPI